MVRLKDMARHLGVSVMTVSKALRDAPDVSAATKTRIKLLAQQMGYVPDSSAQGLRTKTTKLFGLVIPSITNPIFARIVVAIEDRAHELGYDVLLAHSLNQPEREENCIRRLLSRRVDGLFISPVYRFEAEARIYQEVLVRKTPTVLLGPPAAFCKSFPSIEIEELIGSYTITQHLLKLGHKRIAYLTGPSASPWSQERLEGYRRALREAGLDVDDKLVFQAGSTIEDGTKCRAANVERIVRRHSRSSRQRPGRDWLRGNLARARFENSRGYFNCRFWKYFDDGTFSRSDYYHSATEIPAWHRRRGNDDEFDSPRARSAQTPARRTYRTQKYRAAESVKLIAAARIAFRESARFSS